MRCKKHPSDRSSSVGVCATCLRERLVALIAAQVQAQQQAQLAHVVSRTSVASEDYPRNSDPNEPPPLTFPRSVSPYVSRRKSASWLGHDCRDRLVYRTPQLGPTYCGGGCGGDGEVNYAYNGNRRSFRKRMSKFWIFSNPFRFRSEKFQSDLKFSSQESCEPSSSASPSWFSTIFPARRKNQDRTCSSEDRAVVGRRRYRPTDRGMSPVRTENFTDECDQSPSRSGYSTESSPWWRKTPAMAAPSARRSRLGHGKNVSASGISFCLSPLMRASPNRWLGLPPELAVTAEIRGAAAKPHLSAAASFCSNRSRKLADFGRFKQNR